MVQTSSEENLIQLLISMTPQVFEKFFLYIYKHLSSSALIFNVSFSC